MFDAAAMSAMNQVAEKLVEYTPEHFKVITLAVRPCARHTAGRLLYEIGSPDFPDQGTNKPSPGLHAAAHELYRAFTRGGQPFAGFQLRLEQQPDDTFKSSLRVPDEAPPPRDDEALWQAVYDARVEVFERALGPLPNDIQKLLNLSGVWPGGGLFKIAAPRLGLTVCSSFGLSNPDMPARTRSVDAKAAGTGVSMTLEARTPAWAPDGGAGYGYELLIATRGPADWPLLPLSWFVQMELLNDVDIPGRVRDGQGLTVESLKIDGERKADFLVEPARAPFPTSFELPNGTVQVFVATRITRDEMQWALDNGRPALSEKLTRAGVGQVSDLTRPSVLT